MRLFSVLACILLAGCSSVIQSVPMGDTLSVSRGEFVYMLPKGIMNVIVFADEKGVGITMEPAKITKDSQAGQISASTDLSIFNEETVDFKTTTPGLLSLVMVDSVAKILEIVEEAARSAARISLQNAKTQFLATKAVLLEVQFDPLSPTDVKRASRAVCEAVYKGGIAYLKHEEDTETQLNGCKDEGVVLISLSVHHTDGALDTKDDFPTQDQLKAACVVGICARTMTTRVVRIELDGILLGSHVIDVPARSVVAVPIKHSILATRKTTVTLSSGILKEYNVKKESELLTLVKLPSAAIGGFLAGLTEQLTAEATVADKQKALAESQTAAIKAGQELATASVNLQSSAADSDATAAYTSQSVTVYPYLIGFTKLLKNIKKNQVTGPDASEEDGDLTSPVPQPATQPATQ